MLKATILRPFATLALLSTALPMLFGCASEITDEEDEEVGTVTEELRGGANGAVCKRSPYNCKLRSAKGQRVLRGDGGETWAIDPAWLVAHGFVRAGTSDAVVPVVDGNGDEMGRVKRESFTLNFGQTRRMSGLTYVYALSTGLASGGWVPLDAFRAADSLRQRVGEVNARGAGLGKMACYEVKSTFPSRLDAFKVVKGATDADAQEPDDYLPMKRANGQVYVNLAYSTPGNGLGAPSVDIFPAGTKFQRVDVDTWESPSRPSLDATLYAKLAGSDRHTKPAGDMKFIYGYVKSKQGAVRYGWMALDGLRSSSGCPDR